MADYGPNEPQDPTTYGPRDTPAPPSATAPVDKNGPQIGEVRTGATSGTWKWNGHSWEPVPRTFLGTEDFTGRMKAFAKPVVKTMASDIAAPILHPIDTATNLASAAVYPFTHPSDTLEAVKALGDPATYRGLAEGASNIDPGNPELVGHVLALAAAPKVYDTTLGGVNKAARAVASNPSLQANLGMLTGAIAGGPMLGGGWTGRILGGTAGRMAGPLLEKPASAVANATDKAIEFIHGTPETATALPTVPPELQEQYSALTKEYGQKTADTWLDRQKGKTKPPSGSGGTPTAPPPKGGPPPSVGPRTTIEETGETPEQWRARVNAQTKARNANGREIAPLPTDPDVLPPPKPVSAGMTTKAQQGNPVAETATRMSREGTAADTLQRMNAEIQRLRNEFSADKLGPILNPGAPEAAADAVRKAAPGPSEMPDVAQRALYKSLQSGQMNERGWRALAQRINELTTNKGAVKTTPDTQQLLEWLKKYGFKTGQE